jgi:Ca2+-binding EF-hand superfamily protein
MSRLLLVMGVAGAAAVAAVAGQDRGLGGFGPPPSRLLAVLDANRDGVLSTAEMQSAAAALLSLDANGDGRVTFEELRPAPGTEGPREGGRRGRGGDAGPEAGAAPALSPADLSDTLMAFDRNGDGTLNRDEVSERFRGLFDRADANNDGILTKDELQQTASASLQADRGRGRPGGEGREFGPGRRGRGGMGDPLIRALDTDADGALSPAEIAAAPESLKALDVNGDGRLSADELFQGFGRGRGRGDGPVNGRREGGV